MTNEKISNLDFFFSHDVLQSSRLVALHTIRLPCNSRLSVSSGTWLILIFIVAGVNSSHPYAFGIYKTCVGNA